MKDINFFSSYLEVKKKHKRNYGYALGGLLAFLLVFGGLYSYNSYQINNLNKQIQLIGINLNSKEIINKYKNYTETKRKLGILNEYYALAKDMQFKIAKNKIINSDLLDSLEKTFPKKVFLSSIAINLEQINMQGITDSRLKIAEFQHNLKDTDMFSDVHVNVVNSQDGSLLFSIRCFLKGEH